VQLAREEKAELWKRAGKKERKVKEKGCEERGEGKKEEDRRER
jgi:hypothetical protein